MKNFSVFLKHRTGNTAIAHMDADASAEALEKLTSCLGEGWEAVGALERSPQCSIPTASPIGRPPTQQELEDRYGLLDAAQNQMPDFAIFNFDELASFKIEEEQNIHYVYLLKQAVETKSGWGHILWEERVPRDRALKWVQTSRYADAICALYERAPEYGEPNLFERILQLP